MSIAIGDRIIAIENANDQQVNYYGYGVYQGEMEHPHFQAAKAELPEEVLQAGIAQGFDKTPRLKLDDGTLVYGCFCHWGPVEGFDSFCGDRELVLVPVPEEAQIKPVIVTS